MTHDQQTMRRSYTLFFLLAFVCAPAVGLASAFSYASAHDVTGNDGGRMFWALILVLPALVVQPLGLVTKAGVWRTTLAFMAAPFLGGIAYVIFAFVKLLATGDSS